jgi:CHAT domain-containing protein
MNHEAPAILSVNYHSRDGNLERYSVQLLDPDLPAQLGREPQEVLAEDRQTIEDRVRELVVELSRSEASGETDRLEELERKLQSLGRLLCTTFIPPGISEALKRSQAPLVISTELNDLPWELLHLGEDDFLPLKVPFVRNPVVAAYKPGAIEELRTERRQPIRALLAGNPGQPALPMVREELEILSGLLEGAQVIVRQMGREPRDRLEFLGGLADRQFALIHFAGHGHFDVDNPAHSFIRLLAADNVEQQVTAEQLYQHMAGAPVFFLNACESARESSAVGGLLYLAERTKGFATLVISGGAMAFVGTQWPVLDLSAALFGAAFYQQLLAGARVGEAMLRARRACARGEFAEDLRALLPTNVIPDALISQVTWANFVLYGQPLPRFV